MVESRDNSGAVQGSGVAFQNGFADQGPDARANGYRRKLVLDSTWIITNAHVVRDAREVTVSANGLQGTAAVKYRDPETDLAILWAKGFVVPKATISPDARSLQPGDQVYAIGTPKGLQRSITQGIVSAIRATPSRTLIQTSAVISPGSSGGGLFDDQGRLVGITTLKITGGEGLNFAVSAADFWGWFNAATDAEMIRLTTDSENDVRMHDPFVRWLFARPPGQEKRRYEEYEASVERAQANPDVLEGLKQQETYNASLRDAYLRGAGFERSMTKVAQAAAPIYLRCDVRSYSGNRIGVFTYKVDEAKKEVNGYSASIDADTIQWAQPTINYRIDRVSGIIYAAVEGRATGTGPCSKVEGRAF